MLAGLRSFFECYGKIAPQVKVAAKQIRIPTINIATQKSEESLPEYVNAAEPTLDESVHARPPGFCTGCPERPIFTAMKLVERELGEHHVSADIGCHLFSILPPFNLGNTTMGYGLGGAGAAALNAKAGKRAISVMGDGGSGITV